MSDSDSEPAIPSWQRDAQSDSADTTTTSPSEDSSSGIATPSATSAEDQLDVARRFLQDDAVKDESPEKKTAFLREKGISDTDIETLLAEITSSQSSDIEPSVQSSSTDTTTSTPSISSPSSAISLPTSDRPPIVTYPEFLTQPARDPPLVTTNAILTTLSAFAGLATLIHGTSRYLIEPMHESLTEARLDFHATASSRLGALVAKLEETVSEVPPVPSGKKSSSGAGDETDSEADDPTEMFHRDVGTQTSALEDLPVPKSKTPIPSASETQATRLQDLVSSLQPVNESFRTQSTDFHDIGTLIDVFRDDLTAMGGNKAAQPIYGRSSNSTFNGYSYQMGGYKEPDDEIKKARDGIRRVKGLLLSTRNFPASTA